MKAERALRARLEQAGQAALAEHLDTLSGRAREELIHQIERLDLEFVQALGRGEGLALPTRGALTPVAYVAAEKRPDLPIYHRDIPYSSNSRYGKQQ